MWWIGEPINQEFWNPKDQQPQNKYEDFNGLKTEIETLQARLRLYTGISIIRKENYKKTTIHQSPKVYRS